MALSVKPALSESPRPLAGTLPCGDRTFLPEKRGDYPSGKLPDHYRTLCAVSPQVSDLKDF